MGRNRVSGYIWEGWMEFREDGIERYGGLNM